MELVIGTLVKIFFRFFLSMLYGWFFFCETTTLQMVMFLWYFYVSVGISTKYVLNEWI